MNIRFSPASEFPATGSHPAVAPSQAVSPPGAAVGNNSNRRNSFICPGRGYPIGPREGRFSERSPAALSGSAQAENIQPFKAIFSRVNSSFRSARAAFEGFNVSQTLLDIGAICFAALTVMATGLGLIASLLYFCFF